MDEMTPLDRLLQSLPPHERWPKLQQLSREFVDKFCDGTLTPEDLQLLGVQGVTAMWPGRTLHVVAPTQEPKQETTDA
jgi:hypothetical protein